MKESIPLTWRRIPERYTLLGTQCETCGKAYFPPRIICPQCRRKGKIKKIKFSGRGKVYSYTKIFVPPEGFEKQAPYMLAVIELEEGARVTAQIVDTCGDVKIGSPVRAVFRIIQRDDPEGLIHYGFKFRLANDT
ncbi:Zn-ribbon domain-containing OB-fold protein [Candidatus Micrarchaeota archaeon]|nr:Zn-ribbon domain-containing OB-fold protein [Candidatus Micrarchaeota archaeon]